LVVLVMYSVWHDDCFHHALDNIIASISVQIERAIEKKKNYLFTSTRFRARAPVAAVVVGQMITEGGIRTETWEGQKYTSTRRRFFSL
jgi:hypothetical protein